jgi:hypothetical protein
MKKLLIAFALFFISNLSLAADFKTIKKKATVTNPKIIFPIQTSKGKCSEPAYHSLVPKIVPIETLDAPKGYGLDDRFDIVRRNFEQLSIPCSGGNVQPCEIVKKIILKWAKADAPKRSKSGDLWNDTLTINLHINNPMMSAYSFARQLIEFTSEEEKLIEEWFTRTVKRGEHLMYGEKYKEGTGARGVP